jgi:glycosyltransferase involved in cell wall biosynthesis
LLEAGHAQIPIIASRVGGIPELITEDTGFLFESQNTEDFINKIEEVLSLPTEQKEKYTINFYTKMQNEFSITNMIDKTIALYEK